jgi:hypothetical protein
MVRSSLAITLIRIRSLMFRKLVIFASSETEKVSEISDICFELRRLLIREYFNIFSHRESLKSYISAELTELE